MRWSDVLYSQIYFRLSPVMRGIGEDPPEDFQSGGLLPARDVKHFLELFSKCQSKHTVDRLIRSQRDFTT